MMFDIVFVNPPFNHIPEFEKIAIKHSNQYVWMIAKINHMANLDKFKKVIYFKNLSIDTFKEQIEICSYLRDKSKKRDDPIYIEGLEGKTYQTDNITLVPGYDTDAWKYAQDVLDLGLPSYKANYGKRITLNSDKLLSEGGIKVIWSAGGKDDIRWNRIEATENHRLYGLGCHKFFTTERSGNIGILGVTKYADPSFGLCNYSIGVILESEEECYKAIEYLNSPQVKKLAKGIKLTTHNSKAMWAKIPHHSLKDKWFHLYV